MRLLLLLLGFAIGCRPAPHELPVINTTGFEPVIVAQIEHAVKEVRRAPRSRTAWRRLGMVLEAYELHAEARVCYEHANDDPRWKPNVSEIASLRVGFKAWSDHAQQMLSAGKHAEAAPLIGRLASDYPNAPESWLLLGRYRLEQNDCAGAEQAFRQLLNLAPDSINGHAQLGMALICLERYADAVPILRRAIQLKPDFGEAHFNLGFALARSGDGRAAIPAFHKAIRYNPDFIDPYITLADLLSQTGETREATNLLHRALQLNPADERAQTLLRRLQP